jgi:hypothetical protein
MGQDGGAAKSLGFGHQELDGRSVRVRGADVARVVDATLKGPGTERADHTTR